MMFKNRRRAASGPPQKTTPSTNAALAASQAFLKNRSSNGQLSSAAAAAALRSHSTTPVPVGSVQTRRMQRKSSTASRASGGTASPQAVHRQSSSSSMSERTFRTPSPRMVQNKPRSRSSSVMAVDIPAVPALPPNFETHSRAKSAGLSPMSLPSPAPRTPGRRRTCMDEGSLDHDATSTASQSPDAEMGRRSSVNFSRPISPRPTPPSSPPPARLSHSGWFTAPIVNDVTPRRNVRRTSSVPAIAQAGFSQSAPNPAPQSSRDRAPTVETMSGDVVSSHPRGPPPSKTPPRNATIDLPPTPQSSSPASDLPAESDTSSPPTRPNIRFVRKPSTVEETPEAEEVQEGRLDKDLDHEAFTGVGPAINTTTTEFKRARAASQPVPSPGLRVDGSTLQPINNYTHERHSSISPARSAHFAFNAVDVSRRIRHQPPPRSISPIKSALKHSPSSSLRTSSPKAYGKAASDAGSDSGSLDMQRPRQMRKCTRVSFDDSRVTKGDENSVASSNSLDLWYARGGGQTVEGMANVPADVQKPRPTLPSFGSVRRAERESDEERAEKVTEYVPSSMSSSHTMVEPHDERETKVYDDAEPQSVRTHTIPHEETFGSQDHASDEPSTAGSPGHEQFHAISKGYDNRVLEPGASHNKPSSEPLADTATDVPKIAVQPATPGRERKAGPFEMPGSWSAVDEAAKNLKKEEPQLLSASNLEQLESVNEKMASGQDDEDSSDGESIYSDAAEDLSQVGGGFASLDAIVQGPTLSSINASVAPEAGDDKFGHREPRSTRDNVAITKQKQDASPTMVATSSEMATDGRPETTPSRTFERKKKAKVIPEPLVVDPSKLSTRSPIPAMVDNGQPRKPALKTTMRVETPQISQQTPSGAKMRTTMRSSMREPGPSGGLAASRYANVGIPEPRAALQKKKIPVGAAVSTVRPKSALSSPSKHQANSIPVLSRSQSNDSDISASSFQRSRLPSSIRGKYTMRPSMRDSLVELPSSQSTRPISPPPPLAAAKSLSVRSLSPTATFFGGKKKAVPTDQRQYYQTASAPSTPRASRFSRMTRPIPAKIQEPPLPVLRRPHFVDSDDYEGPDLPVFRSRIADSDDEDDILPLPSALRPVRGIPRKDDDGDSTELEDESDVEEPKSPPSGKESSLKSRSMAEAAANDNGKPPRAKLRSSRKGGLMDSMWATEIEAPPKKTKLGLFGLGRKRDSPESRTSTTSNGASLPGNDDSVIAINSLTQPSSDHRRRSLLRNAEESWPLRAVKRGEEKPEGRRERPSIAEASSRGKPKLTKRWSSAITPVERSPNVSQERIAGASNAAVGSTGKKKFPGLRKAFGLKD